jgi:hypothetical protein
MHIAACIPVIGYPVLGINHLRVRREEKQIKVLQNEWDRDWSRTDPYPSPDSQKLNDERFAQATGSIIIAGILGGVYIHLLYLH